MKVRDIRRKQMIRRKEFSRQFVGIPCLGSEGEPVAVLEERACAYALQKFFRSRAMLKTRIVIAEDDALAPLVPKESRLGIDETAHCFQGNGVYITSNLPQYERGMGQCSIARIEKNEEGYTYCYDNAEPVHMTDLSSVKIFGRAVAVCPLGGFAPQVREL